MKVLCVIDCQNDFITGALQNEKAIAKLPKIIDKINQARKNNYQIIFTRDTHFENYLQTQEGKNLPIPHCIKETLGWEIASEIDIKDEDIIIDKTNFGYTSWNNILPKEVEEIEIIGFVTSICVVSNALLIKACYPETPMFVDASCCACVSEESHKAALTTMKMCQIEVFNED